jgi:hypothetical protein
MGVTSTATSPVATSPAPTAATSQPTAPSPSGGAGKVWVNTASKVCHCPGDRWYGRTKHGNYTSEAQAQAQGARPDQRAPRKVPTDVKVSLDNALLNPVTRFLVEVPPPIEACDGLGASR